MFNTPMYIIYIILVIKIVSVEKKVVCFYDSYRKYHFIIGLNVIVESYFVNIIMYVC